MESAWEGVLDQCCGVCIGSEAVGLAVDNHYLKYGHAHLVDTNPGICSCMLHARGGPSHYKGATVVISATILYNCLVVWVSGQLSLSTSGPLDYQLTRIGTSMHSP